MSKPHVFVSFDIEHDEELYERLLAQSRTPVSGFEVSGGSERSTATDGGSERVRRRIREADQLIVICGKDTKASRRVSAELQIAQEERTPYFLLWGRRDIMCTKQPSLRRGCTAGRGRSCRIGLLSLSAKPARMR
jgi:hypothetical protein